MTIFVSRQIKEDSPFHTLQDEIKVIGKSLIDINGVSFSAIPKSDWIYFYSSNGVKHFFRGVQEAKIVLPEEMKFGVMGKGTAEAFHAHFSRYPDFIGDGTKEESISFFEKSKGSILFVKGSNSLESVERYLDDNRVEELTVYSNEPNYSIEIPDADIIVLTSPMNADVYMKKACCRFNTKIIAIGPTTNKTLINHGFLLASVPNTPSEASIVELIKTMIS